MEEGDSSGGDGGDGDVYRERAEPVLVLLSDLYSDDDEISVCDNKYSSYPAYTSTDYLPNEMYTILV